MTTNIMKRNNGTTNEPARSLSGLVDQLFQDNLNRFITDDLWDYKTAQVFRIPVNIRETGKSYELELVAPGIRKEDFKLQVSNDTLTVSFEQKEEQAQEDKNEGWLRTEFKLQSFTRSFSLDETVDVKRIDARYNDGILSLTLPKKENAQKISRTIEIK